MWPSGKPISFWSCNGCLNAPREKAADLGRFILMGALQELTHSHGRAGALSTVPMRPSEAAGWREFYMLWKDLAIIIIILIITTKFPKGGKFGAVCTYLEGGNRQVLGMSKV